MPSRRDENRSENDANMQRVLDKLAERDVKGKLDKNVYELLANKTLSPEMRHSLLFPKKQEAQDLSSTDVAEKAKTAWIEHATKGMSPEQKKEFLKTQKLNELIAKGKKECAKCCAMGCTRNQIVLSDGRLSCDHQTGHKFCKCKFAKKLKSIEDLCKYPMKYDIVHNRTALDNKSPEELEKMLCPNCEGRGETKKSFFGGSKKGCTMCASSGLINCQGQRFTGRRRRLAVMEDLLARVTAADE